MNKRTQNVMVKFTDLVLFNYVRKYAETNKISVDKAIQELLAAPLPKVEK